MSTRSELKDILDRARQEGAIVTQTRSGHYKIRNPETGKSVNIACTPSGDRSLHNALARIRRIGLLTSMRGTSRKPRRERVPSR